MLDGLLETTGAADTVLYSSMILVLSGGAAVDDLDRNLL